MKQTNKNNHRVSIRLYWFCQVMRKCYYLISNFSQKANKYYKKSIVPSNQSDTLASFNVYEFSHSKEQYWHGCNQTSFLESIKGNTYQYSKLSPSAYWVILLVGIFSKEIIQQDNKPLFMIKYMILFIILKIETTSIIIIGNSKLNIVMLIWWMIIISIKHLTETA